MRTEATEAAALAERLLAWYDRHHRRLPWRVPPDERAAGRLPDPYRVWLSEIMLQQTTVAAASGYFEAFVRRWPDVGALAEADPGEVMAAWAGLGYYARARNLLAAARRVVARPGARFPETEAELALLPGIGPYTAAAIAAIAFDRPAAVMDGNVERVMARLFAETAPLPGVKGALRAHVRRLTPALRPGDYAQGVMDLGATICTPRSPACGLCPWLDPCAARAAGIAERLPAKPPKPAKPIRHGVAYAAIDRRGRVLTIRRPDRGLLAGMLALPTGEWTEGAAAPCAPPLPGGWRAAGEVRHTFTHFHLILSVRLAEPETLDGLLVGPADGAEAIDLDAALAAMPTVFAKALRLARASAAAGSPVRAPRVAGR